MIWYIVDQKRLASGPEIFFPVPPTMNTGTGTISARQYYSNHNPERIIITEITLPCILLVASLLVCFALSN